MAAQLARKLGNPDSVKAQLPADLHGLFDMSYQVQADRADNDETEQARRISMRTEEAIEKHRAQRHAAQLMADEEKQALYGAAEADGDTYSLLSSLDLDDLEEAEPLIEGFLVKESVVRLYGPPKSYKSFVMLDMAGCVGAGIQWAGQATKRAKVLYVVAEGVRGIKRRVRAWECQNKRTMTGVHFYPKAVQLGDRKDVSALVRTAKRGGYEFIILDTQARCTVGMEENSASEMGVVVAALDVLKEVTGACVALVHHSGAAGGRARGSTAILGALDAEFEVEADKRNMSVKVKTRAQKDLAEAREMELDLVTPGPGLALAVKARPQWYRQTAADLPPLTQKDQETLQCAAKFSETGITIASLAKSLAADDAELRLVINDLMRKQCLIMKGEKVFLARTGALYIRTADQQLPEDH